MRSSLARNDGVAMSGNWRSLSGTQKAKARIAALKCHLVETAAPAPICASTEIAE